MDQAGSSRPIGQMGGGGREGNWSRFHTMEVQTVKLGLDRGSKGGESLLVRGYCGGGGRGGSLLSAAARSLVPTCNP